MHIFQVIFRGDGNNSWWEKAVFQIVCLFFFLIIGSATTSKFLPLGDFFLLIIPAFFLFAVTTSKTNADEMTAQDGIDTMNYIWMFSFVRILCI